ncbi:hypothetical protein FGSG_04575 [Fusarium graminearum PH-1]|uniref:Chromosome 2, complete genome n=1 Tax=Gibberella zeae (strain ATCC MYA-4620 / CBS 123657 / FGSC 9075 / NRRL 31084 / PH-1) TaxID=229533 RepID=I1RL01_GIBZE|nr:hypothetical protein FGSG_04575 [Fusarium graminearum PH-1]ESU08510.1 hypothetical protein FGSG_04575 [Fusarium graminearum PH-1]CAF3478475.1 unnamed protein product [Fusarium graminearum]CEF79608.1 unnamed protein product [Fusarium graminearum]|eukprot:XP_011321009.1 hypothetical protein FGSG_04575 [Fusarium graminearum PH-1]
MASNPSNVTEFSYVTLKQGINVFDDSPEAKTYQDIIDTVLRQPGARKVYTSLEIENPSRLWLFMDWDKLEDHKNYPKTPEHARVIESLKPLADLEKSMNRHVVVNPFPPEDVLDKASSPVTEVLVAFFPSDYSPSARAAATHRLDKFTAQALKTSPDWRGISYGWSVENDVPIRGDESNSGVMLTAFIGWPSVDAHMKFRETEPFKENVSLVTGIEGMLKLDLFHVSCVTHEAEGLRERDAKNGHGHEHACGSGGCC